MLRFLLDIMSALMGPIIMFSFMYSDIRKGKKPVDTTIIVFSTHIGLLGYEIATESRTTNELLIYLTLLSVVYFISWMIAQILLVDKRKDNSKLEKEL
jgi:hypothetical protein